MPPIVASVPPSMAIDATDHGIDAMDDGTDVTNDGINAANDGTNVMHHDIDATGNGIDTMNHDIDATDHGTDATDDGKDDTNDGTDATDRGTDATGHGNDAIELGIDPSETWDVYLDVRDRHRSPSKGNALTHDSGAADAARSPDIPFQACSQKALARLATLSLPLTRQDADHEIAVSKLATSNSCDNTTSTPDPRRDSGQRG
jgi:hypothetical protein